MDYQRIFNKLWEQYTEKNPSVLRIHNLFVDHGERVQNDHIAFRTLNDPRISVDVLAKPFVHAGYVEKGQYLFPDKKLRAKHYEHQSDIEAPRVFISELIFQDLSDFMKETATEIVNNIPQELLRSDELILAGNVWGTPSFEVYNRLREESEYAAWFYVYGFCANHFTVSVNHLKRLDSLEKVNSFLKEHGFIINDAGGEIKGSPGKLLEQSSIKADHVEVSFTEDVYQVPGCYYEFAKRYKGKDGKLFSGFIAGSADKIFESTDFYKPEE